MFSPSRYDLYICFGLKFDLVYGLEILDERYFGLLLAFWPLPCGWTALKAPWFEDVDLTLFSWSRSSIFFNIPAHDRLGDGDGEAAPEAIDDPEGAATGGGLKMPE